VPGIGAEIVLTVDGELRKTRLFRSHEQAELVGDCGRADDLRWEGVGVIVAGASALGHCGRAVTNRRSDLERLGSSGGQLEEDEWYMLWPMSRKGVTGKCQRSLAYGSGFLKER
jgi:hypothetical protein